jgi:hypothetical protein
MSKYLLGAVLLGLSMLPTVIGEYDPNPVAFFRGGCWGAGAVLFLQGTAQQWRNA